jgi:hypothetical protein
VLLQGGESFAVALLVADDVEDVDGAEDDCVEVCAAAEDNWAW